MVFRVFIVFLLVSFSAATSALKAETVTVFAAASLKNALDDIVKGQDVTVSYAGSSAIARQVERGAPADIIITANPAWMAHLTAQSRLVESTERNLLGNTLVLIAPTQADLPAQSEHSLADVLGDGRIAMAFVDAVPAGIYGKQVLRALGLWDALSTQIVQTDNVRAALRLVALGEVPFGIVYATDALAEPRVNVLHRFATEHHAPILYPLAIVAPREGAEVRPAVHGLWKHFQSTDAAAIFESHGFTVLQGHTK